MKDFERTIDTKQLGLGEVKPPNSNVEIKPGQDVLLTKDDGLEVRLPNESKFDNVVADGETTHLFTIDNNGLKVIKEETTIGGNDVVKHTNLSSEAAFGGEVKFNPDGSVTINPYSGRYGVGNSVDDIETTAKLESTKKYFESLGYEVKTEFSPKSTSISSSSVTSIVNDKDSAVNVANYNKYKDELVKTMGKPEVIDSKLQNFVDTLYRENAKIGSGSTADAVREEILTGNPVGDKYHTQKAKDSITYLQKWINNNPNTNQSDKIVVEHLIKDMQNALNGK